MKPRCSVCGSENNYYAFGFCIKHYPMQHLVKLNKTFEITANNPKEARKIARDLNAFSRNNSINNNRPLYKKIILESCWHKRKDPNSNNAIYQFNMEKHITD